MVIAVITMNYSNTELKMKLEQQFAESADLTIRELTLCSASAIGALVITMEGLVDKQQLAQSVINPLLPYDFGNQSPDEVGQSIFRSVIASADAKAFSTMEELVTYITSGFAVIAVDGASQFCAVGVQGFAFRGVSEPESEVVQRGSREGFSEPLQINMSMIRRRLKSPGLVFEQMTVGSESQTQLMLCYLQTKVSQELLQTLRERLQACDLETVLASGYLSDYLEDEKTSRLFSGVGISERPDAVCGKLTEGRIAVIVDGTPAVILVPRLFVEEFQGVDDYSNRSYYAAFIRFTKYLSFFAAVFLPGLYVALAQFHPEYFPTQLLIQTSESLAKTPFPVMTETLGITLVYEIMKEAGLRIPKSLGHAVSIVGALVIGESAVTAGIISSSTLQLVYADGGRDCRDLQLCHLIALSADHGAAVHFDSCRRLDGSVGYHACNGSDYYQRLQQVVARRAVYVVPCTVFSAPNAGRVHSRRLENTRQAYHPRAEIRRNGGAGCRLKRLFHPSGSCWR